MRWSLCIVALLVAVQAAAEKCKPSGAPIFRETRGPLRPLAEGEPSPVPVVSFEVFPNGAWRWLESGEAGSDEAIGRSGCASPAALREVVRLVARARFTLDRNALVCEAVPNTRVVYAAPRRRKQIATEAPCGTPVDDGTRVLAQCARTLLESKFSPERCR